MILSNRFHILFTFCEACTAKLEQRNRKKLKYIHIWMSVNIIGNVKFCIEHPSYRTGQTRHNDEHVDTPRYLRKQSRTFGHVRSWIISVSIALTTQQHQNYIVGNVWPCRKKNIRRRRGSQIWIVKTGRRDGSSHGARGLNGIPRLGRKLTT